MEICKDCGKECKTGQGLAGHRRWVHGVAPGAQLPLEQPNPLITKSVLEQVLDERFAVIAEQVDSLSNELPGALSSEELEQLQQQVKDLAERLSAAERQTIDDFSPMEKAKYFVPWMQELSGEDFVKLAINTGHDAQLVPAVDPELTAAIAETFRKQEEEAKVIQGKTDRPGYRYLEHLDMSIFVGEEELDKERLELIESTVRKGVEKIGDTMKIATELVGNLAEIQRRREQAKRKA